MALEWLLMIGTGFNDPYQEPVARFETRSECITAALTISRQQLRAELLDTREDAVNPKEIPFKDVISHSGALHADCIENRKTK